MGATFTSLDMLIGCYIEMSSLFVHMLLLGSAPPPRDERTTIRRDIPNHLYAQYRLLHLTDEASLAEIRMRYRELAKSYHPDAGGCHADFLALQRAYEQIVEHLQTCKGE